MPQKLTRSTTHQPLTHPVRVLQFGTGNFLRAFADWIIDIANEERTLNGTIRIAQVNSPTTDKRFQEQGGLYHVAINGMQNGALVQEARLITCVSPEILNPFTNFPEFLAAAENPDLQFVISNTTEAGIRVETADVSMEVPATTFPGKLTALLYRRYQHFSGATDKGLIFLPCELIEHNGVALRDALLQYAAMWKLEPGFTSWVTDHNLFCNSLVDRIVPGFPQADRDAWWSKTGFEDSLLVAAEPYHLWLIEIGSGPRRLAGKLRSAFTSPNKSYQVQFVEDLAPYRSRKVRILNGAHTAMVPVAYLRGLRTVREAINDPVIADFVNGALHDEILPTLDLPEDELQQFAADVIERFQNPFIHHELKAIALNSIAKFRVRVLPSLLEFHKRKGILPHRLVHALAAWIVFYSGSWKGEALPVNDAQEVVSFFREAWTSETLSAVAERILGHKPFWDVDLTKIPGLVQAVAGQMEALMGTPA